MLFDITRPLGPATPVWPGDASFTREHTATLGEQGSAANVCAMRTSTHAGTHVDAPWHVLPDGATVDRLPLAPFVGPARVVEVEPGSIRGGAVEPTEAVLARLEGMAGARVLFRTQPPRVGHVPTDAGPDRDRLHDFTGLAPRLAEELVALGVVLAGTDAPSVDAPSAADLPSHRILARGGCQVVEGLDLGAVPLAGEDFELVALPLRLEGMDASPVRALLRRSARRG